MANNTITFDPSVGTPYGVNLTINAGSNFDSSFKVLNNDKSNFDLSGYTGSSQMTKTVSVGSSRPIAATFNVGFTSASDGEFSISLGSTSTRSLKNGRYMYDILVSSGSSIYTIASGNIMVHAGISSSP